MKTRFAPSPTGNMHLGSARTALFNFLFAKAYGGHVILRIDDTDVQRSKEHFTANILATLQWLGLSFDALIFQSQRYAIYQRYVAMLLAQDSAYVCTCSKERLMNLKTSLIHHKQAIVYDGFCRQQHHPAQAHAVIRFKAPGHGSVSWQDQLRGQMCCESKSIDDFVILTSDHRFTYNFCSTIDDIECAITHVVRGEDHITNTYKQVSLYQALAQPLPHYTHLPLLLHPSGHKLSKRDLAESVLALDTQGYLPAAVINFLVRLGWSYQDQELFTLQRLIALFPSGKINKTPAKIDVAKLNWLNKEHLKQLSFPALAARLAAYAVHHQQEMTYLSTHPDYQEIVLYYVHRVGTITQVIQDTQFLKSPCLRPECISETLTLVLRALLPADWNNTQALKQQLKDLCQVNHCAFKEVTQNIYLLLTGFKEGPDIALLLKWVGKEVIARNLPPSSTT